MSPIPNDEPVYEDYLEHFPLVKHVGDMIRDCNPPYVLGVCGTWGSGKTSFLRKLWAYLGGPFDVEGRRSSQKNQQWQRRKWFGTTYKEPPSPKAKNGWHVIWFNPWQHQFEQTVVYGRFREIDRIRDIL